MKRRTEQERRELVEAYRRSGLTQEAFAKLHRLNVGTLRGWLYRSVQGKKSRAAPGRFVEVKAPELTTRSGLVLRIGEQISVELEELPAPEYLASLARALGC